MSWSMLTKRAAMQMRSLQPAFVQTFPKIIRPPKSDRLLGWTNATLVLCGHIHDNRDRRSADGFRVICTDSVSTYADGKRHHEGLCYRLIELHATGRVSVTDQVVEAV